MILIIITFELFHRYIIILNIILMVESSLISKYLKINIKFLNFICKIVKIFYILVIILSLR
jgi:hypothetical protein